LVQIGQYYVTPDGVLELPLEDVDYAVFEREATRLGLRIG
jgi:hypothetical protein